MAWFNTEELLQRGSEYHPSLSVYEGQHYLNFVLIKQRRNVLFITLLSHGVFEASDYNAIHATDYPLITFSVLEYSHSHGVYISWLEYMTDVLQDQLSQTK